MPQRAATIEGLPTQTSPCPRRSTSILAGSLDGSRSAMGDERNRVVLGARLYRVERPWGDLTDGPELGLVSQVAVDSEGSLFILQRTFPPLVVIDREGRFLRSFGDGLVRDGHGIYIERDDRVFVVDRDAHQVLIFAVDGTLLGRLGERHAPRLGAPFKPSDRLCRRRGWGDLRIGRLRQHARAPLLARGQAAAKLGRAGQRAGRVLDASRRLGRSRGPRRGGRSRERPRATVRPGRGASSVRGTISIIRWTCTRTRRAGCSSPIRCPG